MKQKLYLAGGFGSNWAAEVTNILTNFTCIDPKQKEIDTPMTVKEYGVWDLHHIKTCDVCLVFVERTNPSCIGLSCEAGFAKGIGKTVISVIEPNNKTIPDRYLSFISVVSDITFTTLSDALNYLKSWK